MQECTANNIAATFDDYAEWICGMTNAEMINWAKKNVDGFEFDEYHSFIPYDNDNYNLMHIFDIDKL